VLSMVVLCVCSLCASVQHHVCCMCAACVPAMCSMHMGACSMGACSMGACSMGACSMGSSDPKIGDAFGRGCVPEAGA
jgi:hypothetical protein